MATFIWQRPTWPQFSWDPGRLIGPLATARFEQGSLLGRLQMLDVASRSEAAQRVVMREAEDSAALDGGTDAGIEGDLLAQAIGRFQEPLTLNVLHDWQRNLNADP